ncbi:hypothetical protein LINPERPRIM_LOCUS32967 [Linum perenne]
MAEAREKETSKKQSDIPPNFVTLVQLRERWLKKKADEEEERKRKEMQDEEERRRKLEETKQRKYFEAIQQNSESSSHRREIRRPFGDAVMVASAQVIDEGNEDEEPSMLEQEKKMKSKKKHKRKKTPRAREKEEVIKGKEVRMEFRPKMENVEKEISNSGKIENQCVPSRARRGKREVHIKFPRNSGNVKEENSRLEIEAKLGELSIEEKKCALEGAGDNGLYQTRSHAEVKRACNIVDFDCNNEKRLDLTDEQTMYDGKCIRGDGELNPSECHDRSDEPHKRSYERFQGSRGRGNAGRGSRGRGNGGQHGRWSAMMNQNGRFKVGVWVRKEEVGSGVKVTVNRSGVHFKDTSN